jgi:DNA-binding NarL/FixJ family response regulator
MTISISNALSTPSPAAASAPSPSAAAHRSPPPTNNPADKVVLTEVQQVVQLYNQGQSVPQIATSLSLAVQAVNSYLGITSSTS